MKTVVIIPIVHSSADLGSLAEAVRERYLRELGPQVWNEHELLVARLWEQIGTSLGSLPLVYEATRIYQDGLPVCGHELEIVREMAAAGSLNHQLLVKLIDRGAVLMGTEEPQLLMKEYQMHLRQLAAAASPGQSLRAIAAEAAELLADRDRFIARRIVETLQESETGLLFLGAAHRFERLELPGIETRFLGAASPGTI